MMLLCDTGAATYLSNSLLLQGHPTVEAASPLNPADATPPRAIIDAETLRMQVRQSAAEAVLANVKKLEAGKKTNTWTPNEDAGTEEDSRSHGRRASNAGGYTRVDDDRDRRGSVGGAQWSRGSGGQCTCSAAECARVRERVQDLSAKVTELDQQLTNTRVEAEGQIKSISTTLTNTELRFRRQLASKALLMLTSVQNGQRRRCQMESVGVWRINCKVAAVEDLMLQAMTRDALTSAGLRWSTGSRLLRNFCRRTLKRTARSVMMEFRANFEAFKALMLQLEFDTLMTETKSKTGIHQLKMLVVRRVKGVAGSCLVTWRQKSGQARYQHTVSIFEDRMNRAGQQAGTKQLKMLVVRRVKGCIGSCIITWRSATAVAKYEDSVNAFEDKMNRAGQVAGTKQLKMLMMRRVKGLAGSCLGSWSHKTTSARFEDTVNKFEDRMNQAGQEAGVKQLKMLMMRRVKGTAGLCLMTWRSKATKAKFEDTVSGFQDQISSSAQEAGVTRLKMMVVRRVKGVAGSCISIWRQKAGNSLTLLLVSVALFALCLIGWLLYVCLFVRLTYKSDCLTD